MECGAIWQQMGTLEHCYMGGLPDEVTEGLEKEQRHCELLHVSCVTSSQNILSAITCEATCSGSDYSPILQSLNLRHLVSCPGNKNFGSVIWDMDWLTTKIKAATSKIFKFKLNNVAQCHHHLFIIRKITMKVLSLFLLRYSTSILNCFGHIFYNLIFFHTHTTRHVHKIRSSRCCSCEDHFTRDLATLVWSLAPPFKYPQNRACCDAQSWLGSHSWWSSPSFLPPGASCMQWCFLSAKGTIPIDIHCQLYEVYGPQCMDVKNVRKWVREFIYGYRCPWRTSFWLAFGFGQNNCKSEARNAWRLACDSLHAMRTDPWSQ